MLYIIDSHAWVEYLIGSEKGREVKRLFDDKGSQFITVECCLAELHGWALRTGKDFEKIYAIIRSNSEIVATFTEEWIQAGEVRHDKRKDIKDFGLIDSMLLVKQKLFDCKILSGDRHFKDEKGAKYIGD